MLEQTLAIVRNTFFESIRQPIVLVVNPDIFYYALYLPRPQQPAGGVHDGG